MQKMRVEMAGMRRDAEHYSRQVSYLPSNVTLSVSCSLLALLNSEEFWHYT